MRLKNISKWNNFLSLSQGWWFFSLQETKAAWGKWNVCVTLYFTESSGAGPVQVRTRRSLVLRCYTVLLKLFYFFCNSSLKWNFLWIINFGSYYILTSSFPSPSVLPSRKDIWVQAVGCLLVMTFSAQFCKSWKNSQLLLCHSSLFSLEALLTLG